MLPETGATELIFLAAVALIVVGPKDLPVLLRKVGQFMAKVRGLAAEFRSSFEELARQSELDELRREVDALRRGDYTQPVRQDLKDIDSHFESLHRELGAPAPSGFGAREGEIAPGPDAPAAALPSPEGAAHHPIASESVLPVPPDAAPEGLEPETEPSPHGSDHVEQSAAPSPSREHAG